jgi:hypothetical protein
MNAPLSQSGAEAPLVRARKAHQAGEPYFGLSGHPWQEWLVTMEDGTRRRTSAPASGGGSGPRAARKNAEEGPYRDLSQPTYRQSVEAALSEGRRAAHPDAGKTAATPPARPAEFPRPPAVSGTPPRVRAGTTASTATQDRPRSLR